MEDRQIIELYWQRNQDAILETSVKYGKYCHAIADAILHNDSDSDECVNDTWLGAWNAMPPHRPNMLKTFLGKITRNTALNRFFQRNAEKRGAGEVPLALDELETCLPAANSTEQLVDSLTLGALFNDFLTSLPSAERSMFVQRYWYFRSIREIAAAHAIGESKVKMSLLRMRSKLKQLLEREEYSL